MATVHKKIAQTFLSALTDSAALDAEKLRLLRELLEKSEKPKPDEFVEIFKRPAGDDIQ